MFGIWFSLYLRLARKIGGILRVMRLLKQSEYKSKNKGSQPKTRNGKKIVGK